MTQNPDTPIRTAAWREQYASHLSAAIDTLTAVARLERPSLQNVAGEWVEDLMGATEHTDWAEFVTLALAGAAANVGGVEAVLAGRSGSWEAEGVRHLLHSTVGADQSALWPHRTAPVEITLYIDEILSERTDAWVQYIEAEDEGQRRDEAAWAADPEIDPTPYVWEYTRHETEPDQWVCASPEAPPWSLEAWREGAVSLGWDPATPEIDDAALLATAGAVQIPKSPEAAVELRRLEEERDARLGAGDDQLLEAQREAEWSAYGDALRDQVLAKAANLEGLTVPVTVTIDLTTVRRPAPPLEAENTLEARLVDDAVMDTPSPADLEGTPLQRLDRNRAPRPGS